MNYEQSLFFVSYISQYGFELASTSDSQVLEFLGYTITTSSFRFFSDEFLIKVRSLHICIYHWVTCTVKYIIVVTERGFAWHIYNKHQFTWCFHIFIMYAHMCAYVFPHPRMHVPFFFLLPSRGSTSRYPLDPWFLPLPPPSFSQILYHLMLG